MHFLATKSALYLSLVALTASIFGGFVYIEKVKIEVLKEELNDMYEHNNATVVDARIMDAETFARAHIKTRSPEDLEVRLELVRDKAGWVLFRVYPLNYETDNALIYLEEDGDSWKVISFGTAHENIESLNPDFFESETITSGWKTYRNEEYGFELQLPPRWTKAKVNKSDRRDVTGGEVVFFSLPEVPGKYGGLYKNVCHIEMYSHNGWAERQKSSDGGKPIYLSTDELTVYGWGCGHDDYGFEGFENYNEAIDREELEKINSGSLVGPYDEFKEIILPTFQKIDIENFVSWNTYISEEYGFEFLYRDTYNYQNEDGQAGLETVTLFMPDSFNTVHIGVSSQPSVIREDIETISSEVIERYGINWQKEVKRSKSSGHVSTRLFMEHNGLTYSISTSDSERILYEVFDRFTLIDRSQSGKLYQSDDYVVETFGIDLPAQNGFEDMYRSQIVVYEENGERKIIVLDIDEVIRPKPANAEKWSRVSYRLLPDYTTDEYILLNSYKPDTDAGRGSLYRYYFLEDRFEHLEVGKYYAGWNALVISENGQYVLGYDIFDNNPYKSLYLGDILNDEVSTITSLGAGESLRSSCRCFGDCPVDLKWLNSTTIEYGIYTDVDCRAEDPIISLIEKRTATIP